MSSPRPVPPANAIITRHTVPNAPLLLPADASEDFIVQFNQIYASVGLRVVLQGHSLTYERTNDDLKAIRPQSDFIAPRRLNQNFQMHAGDAVGKTMLSSDQEERNQTRNCAESPPTT